MFANITSFLFHAGIMLNGDGAPIEEMPDISTWYSNDYLLQVE
jgi:hypothetical protein